jgi:hypothetical protein
LALLAVQTEQTAGRLTKELPGGFLERVDVTVRRMGAKGHATEGEHEGKSAQKT